MADVYALLSLQELQTTHDSFIPSTTMLEMVTTIEAQINDFWNSDALKSKEKGARF